MLRDELDELLVDGPDQVNIFAQLAQMIEANHVVDLPASVVPQLEQGGLKSAELARIVAPKDVILRLVEADEVLPPDLADRVSRVARIISLAEKVFGGQEKAFFWMRMPNEEIGGVPPIQLIERETGAHLVEDALLRIEYSVLA